MTYRKCFLCGKKTASSATLHGFPKEHRIRLLWLQICNLNESDNVSSTKICSRHFTVDDYYNPMAAVYGAVLRLKPGTIPTVSVPNPNVLISAPVGNLDMDVVETTNTGSTSQHIARQIPKAQCSGIPEINPLAEILDTPANTVNEVQVCNRAGTSEARQCQAIEISETKEGEQQITKKIKYCLPRYVGDKSFLECRSIEQAKVSLKLAKTTVMKERRKVQLLQQRIRRLKKKVTTIQDLLSNLRRNTSITENACNAIMDTLPQGVKQLLSRKLKTRGKYSPELRSFALTLQFYSSKAYEYVRNTFNNLLPHPATLRNWYSVIDGRPGFTKESFHALTRYASNTNVTVNIVVDEMAIREQLLFDSNIFYGGVNLGCEDARDNDNATLAKNALVFMAVAINKGWKVPLGYFLINSLSGSERANLLNICLQLLHETGVQVYSLTFDGAPVNISMCTTLGANFTYGRLFKPYFLHPITKEKLLVFWDPSHMLKLVRNTLGDKGMLIDEQNNYVRWDFLKLLNELQLREGLHLANKLTSKHINFNDNRMNVKLCVQLLSESVYNSFVFVNTLNFEQFNGCMATANFCLIFNNIFDLLNCRNKFSKKNKFNIPIDNTSLTFLREHAQLSINYIYNLRDISGCRIIETNRKTGFLGLIVCLTNILDLYEMLKCKGQEYLLSFKISQDQLETFFSAIRSRGGFNNNPNARQFESAYKRLLIRHEVKSFDTSNCLADGIEILQVSSKRQHFTDPIADFNSLDVNVFDHDYINTMWTLNPYLGNVINYISGFIVKRIWDKLSCIVCKNHITSPDDSEGSLIRIKNRGKFIFPSKDVSTICRKSEQTFRENINLVFKQKHIKNVLLNKIFLRTCTVFNTPEMENHISSQNIIDNHKIQLIKVIIEMFLKIRLYHEGKLKSQKTGYIRHKYSKLILFKHQ